MKCKGITKSGSACKYKALIHNDYCRIHKHLNHLADDFYLYIQILFVDDRILKYQEQVQQLLLVPQPEQRSPEWYAMRQTRLTASDVAAVIGQNKYQSRMSVLKKKCGMGDKFTGNDATRWGQKYEPIATMLYEIWNHCTIIEFGLMPHPSIPWLGASPDGICKENGTMLEIKCPYSNRSIDYIPEYYYPQMQIQLECCDLDYCDFLQCKITEYDLEEQFYIDTDHSKERGIIISIEDYSVIDEDNQPNRTFIYAPKEMVKICNATRNFLQMSIWAATEYYNTITSVSVLCSVKKLYWKMEKYTNVTVPRSLEWFEKYKPVMESFWNDVLYYRKNKSELELKINPPTIAIELDYNPPKKVRKSKYNNDPPTGCMFSDDE